MNLQIRDPRAVELAEQLARKHNITPEEAIVEALEARMRMENDRDDYVAKLKAVGDKAKAMAKPGGRDMTKDEIDEMWGH